MDLGLKNKKAIILASTKGLGHGVAEVLASEGCDITICARNQLDVERVASELQCRYNIRAFGFRCDVSNGPDLEQFFDQALGTLSGVDILINNAGGPPAGGVDTFDDADWQSSIDLTLMSVVRASRRVLPIMKQQGFGRIINVTSVSVKEPLPNMVLSNTLRAAVAGYSKSLAKEMAGLGVLVHCVMPGSFLTDRNRTLGRAIASERGISFDDLVKEWVASIPLGRMGDPLEFGEVVAFLASDKYSFSTGTCVAVDGGQIRSLT